MRLFRIDGPICAIELRSGLLATSICEDCGRPPAGVSGVSIIELVSERQGVWVTDRLRVLVPPDSVGALGDSALGTIVEIAWRDGFGSGTPPPVLRLLTSTGGLAAAPEVLTREDCKCQAIRSIGLDPLLVSEKPVNDEEGVWFLLENPDVVLVSDGARELLAALSPDLEFVEVLTPDELAATRSTFRDDNWSDL